MLPKKRIIARLDIKNSDVIKGIHLEGLRKVGLPLDMASRYYTQGADEIVFMDAVASLYRRNSLYQIIAEACKSIFIPVTIGGGLRTATDVQKALDSGADKVSINTAFIEKPELVNELSSLYGAQCLVASIEAKRIESDKWEAYISNGKDPTGKDVIAWAKELESRGVGEILITSIDQEGTKKGFDLRLLEEITAAVKIPVIASGGAGSVYDIQKALGKSVSAVALASLLHYNRETVETIKSKLEI